MAARNKYGGPCYRCGKWVEKMKGCIERVTRERLENLKLSRTNTQWLTQHHECAKKYAGTFYSWNNKIGETDD